MAQVTLEQAKLLSDIYFNPKHPASFQGPEKLFREVKKAGQFQEKGPERLTFSKVQRWLSNQIGYSKNKDVARTFSRNRVVVAGIDDQWEADLAELPSFRKENDGVWYLLCVIDVFSRYAWVVPLVTKGGAVVTNAFEEILDEQPRRPDRIRTDMGGEFKSGAFRDLCDRHNIIHFMTYNEKKANFVERFIQTLKDKLFRYMVELNTPRYIDILQDFVYAYNHAYHSGIRMEPINVTKENEKKLWWQMYLPKEFFAEDGTKIPRKPKKVRFRFKIGDTVRLTLTQEKFDRKYDQKWSTEAFEVTQAFSRYGVPIYTLKTILGEPQAGTYYESEMQKIDHDPDTAFRVGEILARQYRGRPRRKMAFVKWLDWPKEYNSWEPLENVTNPEEERERLKKKGKKRKR